MGWQAHVTVAAVIEIDGRFLLVEELQNGEIVLNQPAGHLEEGETLLAAAMRETHEETAYDFTPEFIVGVYVYRSTDNDITYLRVCFGGRCGTHYPDQPLDPAISAAIWLDRASLVARTGEHRGPLVLQCIDDFLAGQSYPMSLLHHLI